jgi:hypothetical protein
MWAWDEAENKVESRWWSKAALLITAWGREDKIHCQGHTPDNVTLPSTRPPSLSFHHLPIPPLAEDQAVNTWVVKGLSRYDYNTIVQSSNEH